MADEPFTGVAADCVADSGAGIVRAAMSRPAIGRTSDGRTTELPAPLPSGLNLTVLVAGDGENYPQRSQSVAVHYDAFLSDGTAWDSSRKRQKPLRFRVGTGQVIPGLDEGVKQLSLGERARLTVPASWAWGERGFPGRVPPNTDVVFELELIELV